MTKTAFGAACNIARSFVEQVEERFYANLVAILQNNELSPSADIAAFAGALVQIVTFTLNSRATQSDHMIRAPVIQNLQGLV